MGARPSELRNAWPPFATLSSSKMFMTRSEYDRCAPQGTHSCVCVCACVRVHYSSSPVRCRGVNMFSPEGRLFQVEYAIEAIKLGSTALGIRTREGVVLAVEKRVTSSLMEPDSIMKIMEVDSHICGYRAGWRMLCAVYFAGC